MDEKISLDLNSVSLEPPVTHSLDESKLPTVCLVIGMAGSGKTTLMQRLHTHVHVNQLPSYFVNLDPAVTSVPYALNMDIRDTVNYKEVMKQYNLGPNGGILTSLNLFTTRFDQVLKILEARVQKEDLPPLKYVFVDTPGQIEAFTWSASGQIITEALASAFPTVALYVVDTPRSSSPVTFMSNMMYACSIMYKTALPFLTIFNKVDVTDHGFAVEWMHDIDAFNDALRNDDSYMSSLSRSMSLVLDEFYTQLQYVGVSALTGKGIGEFLEKLKTARKLYVEEYKPIIDAKRNEAKAQMDRMRQAQKQAIATELRKDGHPNVTIDNESSAPDVKQGTPAHGPADDGEGENEDEKAEFEAFMAHIKANQATPKT
jgi:GTPase SAR1 family protein